MKLLAINAGSSSLKFRLYEMPKEEILIKGTFERIGITNSFYSINIGNEKIKKEVDLPDHDVAIQILLKELVDNGVIKDISEIKAVGNRVVHGGKYTKSMIVTQEVIDYLEDNINLSPLHNPSSINVMKYFLKNKPEIKFVNCYDTAFHQTLEEKDYLYPVPYSWYSEYGIRKYGAHGLSHKYITEKMTKILDKKPNLIICHIGSGASLSCIEKGICKDTSMGLTPNAGIMMGTRCGDIDYSLIGYYMKQTNHDFEYVDEQLNKHSGLEGITGVSDLRDIDEGFEKKEKQFVLAVDMYTQRIADYIAKYYIRLNGKVDAIIFTAGGGENDPLIREQAIEKVKCLGLKLDKKLNDEIVTRKGKEGLISKKDSTIPIYVYATDEEAIIARDTYNLTK